MEWASWSAFWDMGGAGAFVWGSYFVTALLIGVELVVVLRRRSSVVRALNRLRRAAPPRESSRVIEESVQ